MRFNRRSISFIVFLFLIASRVAPASEPQLILNSCHVNLDIENPIHITAKGDIVANSVVLDAKFIDCLARVSDVTIDSKKTECREDGTSSPQCVSIESHLRETKTAYSATASMLAFLNAAAQADIASQDVSNFFSDEDKAEINVWYEEWENRMSEYWELAVEENPADEFAHKMANKFRNSD